MEKDFPRLRFVGDCGLLVEFGEEIDAVVHNKVLELDRAISDNPFPGFTTSVPSYVAVLVGYDPCFTHPAAVEAHVGSLLQLRGGAALQASTHEVPVCYEEDCAPDLATVATQTGLSPGEVIAAHLSSSYRVYMYGFAPGLAYLGGVPKSIQIPRRNQPVWGLPSGSIIIAGPQCIITPLVIPSGWWNIGRSPIVVLRPHDNPPCRFGVGDEVRFRRIDRSEFQRLASDQGLQ